MEGREKIMHLQEQWRCRPPALLPPLTPGAGLFK